MKNIDPIELIVGGILGIGFFAVLMIGFVGVPLWDYLTKGKVTIFPRYRTYYIVFAGRKALRAILIRFLIMSSFADCIISMMLFNRIAWEGILSVFILASLNVFVLRGGKRIPRKGIFH